MEPTVVGLVLAAALLHAGWNALVKSGRDPFVRLAVVNAAGGLCAVPLLLHAGFPDPGALPYVAGSVLVHHVYYVALALGYRSGDLSHVYPLARGIAPPLVAVWAWALAGERPEAVELTAVLVISAAVVSLATPRGGGPASHAAVLFAAATGLAIAGYTVLDGLGARASSGVPSYVATLFVANAIPFAAFVAWRRGRRLGPALAACWKPAAAGGAASVLAYGLVIWAMSRAPLAGVAALRETSVLFAVWIGTRVLREPFGPRRMVAAAGLAAGIVLLHA